jgi:hypothetical protein
MFNGLKVKQMKGNLPEFKLWEEKNSEPNNKKRLREKM